MSPVLDRDVTEAIYALTPGQGELNFAELLRILPRLGFHLGHNKVLKEIIPEFTRIYAHASSEEVGIKIVGNLLLREINDVKL